MFQGYQTWEGHCEPDEFQKAIDLLKRAGIDDVLVQFGGQPDSTASPCGIMMERLGIRVLPGTRTMKNSIFVIKPYKWEGLWVFDDPAVGLVREPFVGCADTMIDVATAHIPNAMKLSRKSLAALEFNRSV